MFWRNSQDNHSLKSDLTTLSEELILTPNIGKKRKEPLGEVGRKKKKANLFSKHISVQI